MSANGKNTVKQRAYSFIHWSKALRRGRDNCGNPWGVVIFVTIQDWISQRATKLHKAWLMLPTLLIRFLALRPFCPGVSGPRS